MSDEMRPYVVRQGDYLVKLAWVHGFDVGGVWDHPKNEAIKKLRGDHHVLAPGDIIHIPVRERLALPLRKGQTNRYVAKVPKVPLNVVFRASDGTKLADEPCEIQGLGNSPSLPLPKATDGEGKLAFTLPAYIREITIHFPRLNLSFQLRPGEMDPHDEATGIRKRLHHLGFGGERLITDVEDENVLREAIERFQQAAGFEPTGELTDALNLIEARGFASTVGHRTYDDMSKYKTGTRKQFHFYAWPVLDTPGVGVTAKIPRYQGTGGLDDRDNMFVGEVGAGHEGRPWPELNGVDKTDVRDRVFERLKLVAQKGYPLALLWPDSGWHAPPGKASTTPDRWKYSDDAILGLCDFTFGLFPGGVP